MAKKEEDYGRIRNKLSDEIPLDMPYALYISPSHICNFRCFYCLQSKQAEEKKALGIQPDIMSVEMAELIAEQAAKFPRKLKRIMFSGCGEPLVNSDFAKIVRAFSEKGISEKYEINTNAALLSPDVADSIIDAGINRIRISIQGLSSEKYKEVCGVKLDFSLFLRNLEYLYKHKRDSSIYIKIIDACFADGETDTDFFNMFGDKCDSIYIEHLIQAQPNMDDIYQKNEIGYVKSIHGSAIKEKRICPLMFYQMQVDASGNVFPCCVVGLPESFSLGNVTSHSLTEIWGKKKHKKLWIDGLKRKLGEYQICKECRAFSSITQKEDCVDECAENLIQKILRV